MSQRGGYERWWLLVFVLLAVDLVTGGSVLIFRHFSGGNGLTLLGCILEASVICGSYVTLAFTHLAVRRFWALLSCRGWLLQSARQVSI